MSRKTVRVLLVDDHAVVREGYRTLLAKHDGLTVVGEASDAASAYQCYKDTRPDVVIMDISMPGRGGIDAIEHIRRFDAQARILVFTMHGGAAYALQAFRAGARGYVTKSSPPDLLISAVRDVAEGQVAICPEISEVLALDRRARGKDRAGGSFAARVRDLAHDPRRAIDRRDRVGAQCQPQDRGELSLQHQVEARGGFRHRAALFRPAARAGRACFAGGGCRELGSVD